MSEEEAAYVHINARQRVLHSLRMAIICFRGGVKLPEAVLMCTGFTATLHSTDALLIM